MRTTLDIDDILLGKAKARARQTHRTLTGVIEEALRQTLIGTPPASESPAHRLNLKTVRGGLLPGVDIDDRDSLAQIATLCLEQGIDRILTEDRDFAGFSSLKTILLSSPLAS